MLSAFKTPCGAASVTLAFKCNYVHESCLCLSLLLSQVPLNHRRGIKKGQSHKEREWEKKQRELREAHKILAEGIDNWYHLIWQSGTARPYPPAGGDTNKKQAGFPDSLQKSQKREVPSSSESRRRAGEATDKKICGVTVFHSPQLSGCYS